MVLLYNAVFNSRDDELVKVGLIDKSYNGEECKKEE